MAGERHTIDEWERWQSSGQGKVDMGGGDAGDYAVEDWRNAAWEPGQTNRNDNRDEVIEDSHLKADYWILTQLALRINDWWDDTWDESFAEEWTEVNADLERMLNKAREDAEAYIPSDAGYANPYTEQELRFLEYQMHLVLNDKLPNEEMDVDDRRDDVDDEELFYVLARDWLSKKARGTNELVDWEPFAEQGYPEHELAWMGSRSMVNRRFIEEYNHAPWNAKPKNRYYGPAQAAADPNYNPRAERIAARRWWKPGSSRGSAAWRRSSRRAGFRTKAGARSAASSRRGPGSTRTFNGVQYSRIENPKHPRFNPKTFYSSKKAARAEAHLGRTQDKLNARVVPVKGGWAVYFSYNGNRKWPQATLDRLARTRRQAAEMDRVGQGYWD